MSHKKIIIQIVVSGVVGVFAITFGLMPESTRQKLWSLVDAPTAEASINLASPSPYRLISADIIEGTNGALIAADIRTDKVATSDVPVTLTLTGKTALNLDKATQVRAQFGGRIIKVHVKLGDKVLGPDEPDGPTVLCVIESNDLAQKKASYLQEKIQLKIDTDTRDRLQGLFKDNVVNEKQLIDAESAVIKGQATLDAARQELLIFGLKQEEIDDIENQVGKQRMDYVVTAPRTGIVAEKGISGGEIADSGLNLFTIADTQSLWVVGNVYERDLNRIALGQPIKAFFASEPTRARECTIDWISPSLDPNTRSVHIQGVLDNSDGRLLADMYGTLVVTLSPGKDSIVIPASAVVREDMMSFVFLEVDRDDGRTRFQRSPVKVESIGVGFGISETTSETAAVAETIERNLKGTPSQGLVRIVSGIQPGDAIIVNGALGLWGEMVEQASGQ